MQPRFFICLVSGSGRGIITYHEKILAWPGTAEFTLERLRAHRKNNTDTGGNGAGGAGLAHGGFGGAAGDCLGPPDGGAPARRRQDHGDVRHLL